MKMSSIILYIVNIVIVNISIVDLLDRNFFDLLTPTENCSFSFHPKVSWQQSRVITKGINL